MTPLLDVVFLLLTFFIFTWVMMVRAQVMPMQMVAVQAGGRPGDTDLNVLAIDKQGQFFFNRQPIDEGRLETRLRQFAEDPTQPTLYIAVEAQGELDRAPLLVRALQQVYEARVQNFMLVGPPAPAPGSPAPGSSNAPGNNGSVSPAPSSTPENAPPASSGASGGTTSGG